MTKALETRAPRTRRAFSLIELLAVVGIIAVLVALLLPTLGRSRQQARTAQCANQMHEIYLAGQNWKIENERTGNRKAFGAQGWMDEWAPYFQYDTAQKIERRMYVCPEDPSVLAGPGAISVTTGGDQAGTTSGTTGLGAAGTGGTSGTATAGAGSAASGPTNLGLDPSKLFMRTYPNANDPSKYYDLPLVAGPWVKRTDYPDGSYDLWAEHQFFNNGAKDFDDVGVHISTAADGTVSATLLPRHAGHLAYRDDVMCATTGGGVQELFNNTYGSSSIVPGTAPGASAQLTGPNGGGAGDNSDGPVAGSSGSAGSGAGGASGTLGSGVAGTSYGLNANLKQIDGSSDKIFGMDYLAFSVIDPAQVDFANAPTDKAGHPTFARHNGYANILYGDGSVRLDVPTKVTINPAFGDNRTKLWEKR